VVRILTTDLDMFAGEDLSVLRAGLITAPFIAVDDTVPVMRGVRLIRR
jgi:hypothetical protein